MTLKDTGPWTETDFDRLSWHDVDVYGFRLESFDEALGTADLVLDIDYILAWNCVDGAIDLDRSRASLRFHQVFGLKVALDYAAASAGMCAFSLDAIHREPLPYDGWRWRLEVNWPMGVLEFEAKGFTQTLSG